MGPKPSDTNMLAMPIMMAIINVAFLRPIFSFTSAVRIFVSKKLNRDEMTANISARKKQLPIMRPPGRLRNMPDMTSNTRAGPF